MIRLRRGEMRWWRDERREEREREGMDGGRDPNPRWIERWSGEEEKDESV